jgi:hypothetical protein
MIFDYFSSSPSFLVSSVGFNEDLDYEKFLNYLIDYKKQHENCDVRFRFVAADGYPLGAVCGAIRAISRGPMYSPCQRSGLENVGFNFSYSEYDFRIFTDHIAAYFLEYKSCDVPFDYVAPGGYPLGIWCAILQNYESENPNKIPDFIGEDLAQLDFKLKLYGGTPSSFVKFLFEFSNYKTRFGHCNIPIDFRSEEGFYLGSQFHRIRSLAGREGYPASRLKALREIGFNFSAKKGGGKKDIGYFEQLVVFKREYGHCNVPYGYKSQDGRRLDLWCCKQRTLIENNKLSVEYQQRLKEIDFPFFADDIVLSSGRKNQFPEYFELLVAFKKEHGHCNVHFGYKSKDGKPLGAWCGKMRRLIKNNKLSAKKVKEFQEIGFPSVVERPGKKNDFLENYDRLVAFERKYGHCTVPIRFRHPDGSALGFWCLEQRKLFKKNRLPVEHLQQLQKIGFEF